MNKYIKALTLVLVGFAISLSLSNQREVEKVKGSELVWQEAQTIVSGKQYLITAESGDNTYYLQAKGQAHIQYAAVFNFSVINSNLWTFSFVEGKGHLISDSSDNILYCLSSGTNLLAADSTGGSIEANKYWTLTANNELKTGVSQEYTLSLEPSGSTKTWSHEFFSGRIRELKFYALGEKSEGETAASFATWIMAQESGEVVTPQCNTKYNTAKAQWNALSSVEQELFKTDQSFNDARARLTNWAVANGETIEYFYSNSLHGKRIEKVKNNGLVFMIVAALTVSAVLILSKKTKVKE